MTLEFLTFVETAVFTKRISALRLEESLRGLQLELLDNPEAGDVEPGTSGLRKVASAIRRGGKESAAAPARITCGSPIAAEFT